VNRKCCCHKRSTAGLAEPTCSLWGVFRSLHPREPGMDFLPCPDCREPDLGDSLVLLPFSVEETGGTRCLPIFFFFYAVELSTLSAVDLIGLSAVSPSPALVPKFSFTNLHCDLPFRCVGRHRSVPLIDAAWHDLMSRPLLPLSQLPIMPQGPFRTVFPFDCYSEPFATPLRAFKSNFFPSAPQSDRLVSGDLGPFLTLWGFDAPGG